VHTSEQNNHNNEAQKRHLLDSHVVNWNRSRDKTTEGPSKFKSTQTYFYSRELKSRKH